ncbi:MAG: dihydrolipoamide acetyltransferase family protein [Burkholderiaceae bacterium]
MGHYIIKTPDIGEGIAEVELVAWHVRVGDSVQADQLLADVMTDKATVEIPSPVAGTVLSLSAEIGQSVAVGSELVRLEVAGAGNVKPAAAGGAGPGAARGATVASVSSGRMVAAAEAPSGRATASGPTERIALKVERGVAAPASSRMASGPSVRTGAPHHPTAVSAVRETGSACGTAPAASSVAAQVASASSNNASSERPIASPAVRRRAWELGVDLAQVAPGGAGGRIMHADLEDYARSHPGLLVLQPTQPLQLAQLVPTEPPAFRPPAYARVETQQEVPVLGLRRKIAAKMQESKRRIPHFNYVEEVDVTEVETLRERLNARTGAQGPRITLLPLLARAMVLALREFPQINARFDDERGVVTRFGAVHLGIATQTGNGLMVPVLRHLEALDLWASAEHIARLAEAARSGRITREELSGSTITVTSLGALGGIVSTPVINHPEVAIVGVNRIVERPMVVRGAVVVRKMMNLSSSFDHRVVDGADAARFVQALRGYLEVPATLFVE